MKVSKTNIIVFILSIFVFALSLRNAWYMGIYTDISNSSLDIVLGGYLWVVLQPLRLLSSLIICIYLLFDLIKKYLFKSRID